MTPTFILLSKARPDQYADDEDLHCLVLADNEESVAACVKMISKVIETVRFHRLNLVLT